MPKYNKYQNGFGFIAVLLLVLLAGVIIGGIYYVGTYNNKKLYNTSSSNLSAADPLIDWKTYTEPADKSVSFKYPDGWKLGDFAGPDIGNGVKNVSVTSPNGTELDLRSTDAGLGGDCLETQHTKVTYSKPINTAPELYVVEWEIFDGSKLLSTGLDVLNGSSQGSKVYSELGNHTACITFNFAFTSSASNGYFFGLKNGSKLDSKDLTEARQILGSLTLK